MHPLSECPTLPINWISDHGSLWCMDESGFECVVCIIIFELMSIESSLTNLSDVSLSFETSLRNSIRIPDSRAHRIQALKKSQDLTHSRKTMLKNGSSETFETDLPRKTFEKIFDQTQIYGLEQGFGVGKQPRRRWSVERRSISRNSRDQTLNKHRKTFSINKQGSIREASAKTQPSNGHILMPSMPLSIQKLMREGGAGRFSLSRSIEAPEAKMTINQLMMSKFSSRRKYENSKIVRRDMLPKFLKFSISKCQLHEKVMIDTLSSSLFKKHEAFFDSRHYKL